MTTQPEDPWADPDYRPELAPPMSDGFYRAIGDYCRAENAETEPSFIGGLPEDRVTGTAEHEIAATDPEAEAGWRESMAVAYLYGTLEPTPGTAEAAAFAEMDAYARAEAERVAALDEADAAWAAEHANDPVPEPDLEAEPW